MICGEKEIRPFLASKMRSSLARARLDERVGSWRVERREE